MIFSAHICVCLLSGLLEDVFLTAFVSRRVAKYIFTRLLFTKSRHAFLGYVVGYDVTSATRNVRGAST